MKKFSIVLILGLIFTFSILVVSFSQQPTPGGGRKSYAASGPLFTQQKARANNGSTAVSTNWDTTMIAGDSAVIIISFTDAVSSSSGTLSGGGSEVLTRATTSTITGNTTEIWYVHNVTGGETNATITLSGTSRYTINALEFSGLKNINPEATNTNSALVNSTVTTNSVAPSSTNNLIIASGAWAVNDYSSGPILGFTRLTSSATLNVSQEGAYLIQSSATSQSTGWTLTAGINWCSSIVAFGAN